VIAGGTLIDVFAGDPGPLKFTQTITLSGMAHARKGNREAPMNIRACIIHDPIVYLIHMIDTWYYKIGMTTNIASRLSSLSTASPVGMELIAWKYGGADQEKQLHDKYHAHRTRGEWFKFNDDVTAHVLKDFDCRQALPSESCSTCIHATRISRAPKLRCKFNRTDRYNAPDHVCNTWFPMRGYRAHLAREPHTRGRR
jgi:hypothetical protein